jgi:hypothetical protein
MSRAILSRHLSPARSHRSHAALPIGPPAEFQTSINAEGVGWGEGAARPVGNADDGTKEWFVGAVLLESEEAREAGPNWERH